MPREGQLIPKYWHPHVETYINDNTVFTQKTEELTSVVDAMFIFFSPKGRDNKIIKISSLSDFLDEYGTPNMNYGQACYMPYAKLSGGTPCYCMRVTDTNSSYANVVISAKVKWNSESSALDIKYVAETIPTLKSLDAVSSEMDTLTTKGSKPDSEQYLTYPLFCFYSTGKGDYGNDFRVRMTPDNNGDRSNEYKNYTVELSTASSGMRKIGVFSRAMMYVNGIVGTKSYFLDDLINDEDEGSTKINVYTDVNNFEKILEVYNTNSENPDLIPETADILFGKNKLGVAISDINISTEQGSTVGTVISLDDVNGIPLESGDNGNFGPGVDPSTKEKAIEDGYLAAFGGKLDKGVLSTRRFPVRYFYDANYSENVKSALIALVNKREDCQLYLDAGIQPSTEAILTWAEQLKGKRGRLISTECQHYDIKDPFTGKRITMTTTYFLASIMSRVLEENGLNTAITGEAYAKLSGHIKNSLYPIIDADDKEVKEKLYNLKVNYFEAIGENSFIRATQSTSQEINSDLSEENNMRVTLDIKRNLEAMNLSKIYNLAEPEDRKLFKEAADRLIAEYRGMCRDAQVDFAMNSYEEERSILHCYLSIVFKSMVKVGIIEIDINPRV